MSEEANAKYRPYPVASRFVIDSIYTAFSMDIPEDFVFQGESHDFWEMVFVRSGKIVASREENVFLLERNNLLIHEPLRYHSLRGTEGNASEIIIISFGTVGTLPAELNRGIFTLDDACAAEYTEICGQWISLLQKGAGSDYDAQEAVDRLSAFLIRISRLPADLQLISSPEVLVYRDIVSVMREKVCENWTLEDFARSCNISVSYLKLLFKKYAAMSPKSYFTGLRVQYAVELLKKGCSAISIANQMNFSSPNYFSVFFKKHMGEVPSVYRRRL